MGGVLQLDPGDYVAASATMGQLVAPTVRAAGDGLTAVLSGCGAMGGSDPVGVAWAGGYDAAAGAVLAATQDAVNGAYRLAGLLEQSGFNYSTAEAASTTGGGPPPLDTRSYGEQPVRLDPVPDAAGSTDPALPTAWSQVQDHVGRVWPNGHQDTLHRAATGWQDGACLLYDASYQLADTVASIALQLSPERDEAITVCNSLRDTLQNLAESYKSISTACTQYADHLDHAHQQARHELRSLLEWMAGIEIAGAAVAILTFGASEVVSQATVLARTILTATRITTIIDRLATLTTDIVETLSAIPGTTALVARGLEPLLATERIAASTTRVAEVVRTRSACNAADDALAVTAAGERIEQVPAAGRFRNRDRLIKHFDDHAADFGAVSPEDYEAKAAQFLEDAERKGYLVKVDAKGIIRIYDPATHSFGSFAPDGTIFTYFKPSSPTYWERQPGS